MLPLDLARNNVKRGIREAKRLHGQKLTSHFVDDKDPRRLWQGFQSVTGYKPTVRTSHNEPSLPDNLNAFYSWFEATNNSGAQRLPSSPSDQVLQLSADGVKRVFSNINPRKAAGPDSIPGRVLKDCAEQLKDIFRHI